MKEIGIVIGLILSVSLFILSDCIGQNPKKEFVTVQDSLTFKCTPYWLGSRAGFNFASVVGRGGARSICVLEDNEAYKYLNEHNGQININEVYRNGENAYEMPEMVLFASKESPLDLWLTDIKKCMRDELVSKLTKLGKIKGDKLIEELRFLPVCFNKQDNQFEVSGWLPTIILQETIFSVSTTAIDSQEINTKLLQSNDNIEMESLLANATHVSHEKEHLIWQHLKLYIKKAYSNGSFPFPFFDDIQGESDITNAKLYFKIIGDELKIGEGAIVKFINGEKYFFLKRSWFFTKDVDLRMDEILRKIRESKQYEVDKYEKKAEQGMHYSTISGSLK